MKRFKRNFLIVSLFIVPFLLIVPFLHSNGRIKLVQDLSIGIESGDENYIFGKVSDITINPTGDIFILDTSKSRIMRFSSNGKFLLSIGREGEGPGEFRTPPIGIESDGLGNILVAELRRIHIFKEDGSFVRSFMLDFQCNDLTADENGNVVILGLKEESIFHIYDKEGKNLLSFGKPLNVPEKYSKYKEFPNLRLPFKIYFTQNRRLAYINPYKYEIVIFKGNQFERSIKGESEFYKPAEVMEFRRGIMVMNMEYSILEHKDTMYIALLGEKESHVDIFKKYSYFDSIKIKSFPKAIDDMGRIYTIDESEFPKIQRLLLTIR